MKNNENFLGEVVWSTWVGKYVFKYSNKPFKNGNKIGKVMNMEINPLSNKIAFKMEDGTLVDCFRCKLYTEIK